MSKYCEYCSHSLDDSFNCNPCVHLDVRQYADNTVMLKDLFVMSPSKATAMRLNEAAFHCGIEESVGHAYNCNDCPNKCEEWYQWGKEFKKKGDEDESNSNDN